MEEGLGAMQAREHVAVDVPMVVAAHPFVRPSIFKGVVQPAQTADAMILSSHRVLLGRQNSGLKEVVVEEDLGAMHARERVPMAVAASPLARPSIFKGVVQPAQLCTPAPARTSPSAPEALPPVMQLPGQVWTAVKTPELMSSHQKSAVPLPARTTRIPPPLPPFSKVFQQAPTERRVAMANNGVAVKQIFRNPRTRKWQGGPEAQSWGQGWEVSYQLKGRH